MPLKKYGLESVSNKKNLTGGGGGGVIFNSGLEIFQKRVDLTRKGWRKK